MSDDALYQLALVGSRAGGFQHDLANTLQHLVNALDEIEERAALHDDTAITHALASASGAIKLLMDQLRAYRALRRPGEQVPMPVRDLIERAAARAHVRVVGEPPAIDVTVAAGEVIQALAMLFDEAALGPQPRAVAVAFGERGFTLPAGDVSAEAVAIARHVYRRGGGDVARDGDVVVVTWPS